MVISKGRQVEEVSHSSASSLLPSQSSHDVEKLRGPFKKIRRRFRDPLTDETLGKDLKQVFFVNIAERFNFITPGAAREYFKAKYGSWALYNEAASLRRDTSSQEDSVKRAEMLRMSTEIFSEANQIQWSSSNTLESKKIFEDIINGDIALNEKLLKKVEADILRDAIYGVKRPMTKEECDKAEESLKDRSSASGIRFLSDKLHQKRVQTLEYIVYGTGFIAASGVLGYVSSIKGGVISIFAGALATGAFGTSAHPFYKARIEFIKVKAADLVLAKRFNIVEPELKKKDVDNLSNVDNLSLLE